MIGVDEHFRRAGAAYHQIRQLKVLGKIFEANWTALNAFGQLHRPLEGSIGHHQTAHAVALQMARHQIAHFTGADQHDGLIVETVENPPGEIHRDRAHRHRAAADPGFAAHAFGDGERTMEQAMQDRPDGSRLLRRVVILFQLAENLRFADDK